MKFEVQTNISWSSRFDVVVGLGLYLPLDKEQKWGKCLLKSLDVLKTEFTGKRVLFAVVDDASPVKLDLSNIFEHYVIVSLEQNQGIGQKENCLEGIAYNLADYLFRLDQDVALKGPIEPMFQAFQDIEGLFVAGINSGFMGAQIVSNPEKLKGVLNKRITLYPGNQYVDTWQLGNAVLEKTKGFEVIGFTDPKLRYFHDLDLFFRARERGFKTVMVMASKGSAKAGRTAATQKGVVTFKHLKSEAEYLCSSNPCLSFYLKKDGLPVIRYTPSNKEGLFKVEPCYKKVGLSVLTNQVISKLMNG